MAEQKPSQSVAAPAIEFDKPSSLLDKIINENRVAAARQLPVMDIEMAMERNKMLQQFIKGFMKEGDDFGKIPGTGEDAKPSLFKSGAEKLNSFFGYVPYYETTEKITDWMGEKYGEPLFYWDKVCTLMKDGTPVGQGNGSCSSWEKKYRYRAAGRVCPSCGSSTSLIKGKAEYERDPEYKQRGSWVCYEKKGGCNAKYFGDDPDIMSQHVGQVANPDIADIINTVQKMADKRAYVAATLTATGASQYFSQDLEDIELPDGATQPRGKQQQGQQGRKEPIRQPVTTRTPQTAPPPPQAPPIPQDLRAAAEFIGDKFSTMLPAFQTLHRDIEEMGGSDAPYYEVLDSYGWKHADKDTIKTAGRIRSLEVARDLLVKLNAIKISLAEPEDEDMDRSQITTGGDPA